MGNRFRSRRTWRWALCLSLCVAIFSSVPGVNSASTSTSTTSKNPKNTKHLKSQGAIGRVGKSASTSRAPIKPQQRQQQQQQQTPPSPQDALARGLSILESSILGVLPSAQLTRYLARLRFGGSLYDPHTLMSTEDLIRREGYPVETYTVRTEDGYLPSLVRIPRGTRGAGKGKGKGLGPVLMTHGVLQCSDNWVLRGKDHDLPFLLADAGYDVWLANSRGTTYSRSHRQYPDNDRRFWDFTLHEPGAMDLPAFMDRVLEVSEAPDMLYIGHSMGTTIFYILGATRPDLMKKVRLSVHLAPVTYWSRIQSPVAKRAFQAAALLKRLDMPMLFDNYSSRSNRSVFLADALCRDGSPAQRLCAEALFSIVGADKAQLNMTMLPMIFAHFPAGASVGQVAHYYQNYEQADFRRFDHGREGNIARYGTPEAPRYNMSLVTAPVAIWYSLNDRLVWHEDVVALSKKLPNVVGLHLVSLPKFNHFDFLWAKDSKPLLYNHVMEVMSKF